MEALVEEHFQKVAAYKSLFDSAGWKDYEERLIELAEAEQVKVAKLLNGFVSEEDRERLNFSLSLIKGLNLALIVKQEMLEDVGMDNSPQEGVQNTSEDES